MNKKNKGFLFALLLLLGAYPLKAQEACIDFEDFQLGTFFGPELGNMPGDTLFEQSGAVVTAQTFQYANGQIGFLNSFIEGPPDAPWLDGNYLFISNNTLLLHFPPGTQQVCFDFFDLGGDDNFAVNGAAVSVLDQFTEVEGLSFPGVTIELSLDTIPGINLLIGTVCLSGDIESLLIGGQEFGIDNICFSEEIDDNGDDACLGFEGLDPPSYGSDAGTPPGQIFYEEGDVNLRLAPFQGIFWTTTYGNLQVRQAGDTPGFTAASGQHLKFEGINTIFDLTGYPEPADSVVVDFYYTGGAVNLAANGAPFLIQSLLTPGFYALAPGVTLEVNFNSANSTEGQFVFAGNLQSLLIGGETGLYLDNFCVNPQPNCELGELTVEAGPCNPNGVFTVNLALDGYTGTADSFALWINGNDTGQRRAYTDMPVVLFPFVAPTPALTFTIVDLDDPDCQATAVLPPNNCAPACPLESVDILAGPICSNTGQYTLRLRVDGPDVGDVLTIRSLITNASSEVALGLNNILSVTLPVPANGADSLSICLTGTSANVPCCLTLAIDVDCPPLPCTVIDSVIYHLTDCGPNGTARLVIDQVLYTPTFVLSFSVFVNGQFFGPYSTAMLPISVGSFSPDDGPLEVLVTENQTNACGYVFTAGPVDCGGNCPLEIGQILPNSISCYDNYTYNASILLPGAVPGTSLIVESGATGYRDTLLYSNTSVTLGLRLEGWPTPPNGIETLSICAFSPSDCCITLSFEVLCPPDGCELAGQLIGTPGCEGVDTVYQGLVAITGASAGDTLAVSSSITGASTLALVELDSNGRTFIRYELPNTGQFIDAVTVCELNAPNCCFNLGYNLDCHLCGISEVDIQPLPCDGDSLFYFTLNFEAEGQFSDSFTLSISNVTSFDILYSELPVTIGPLPAQGNTLTFLLSDESSNCSYFQLLDTPDCNCVDITLMVASMLPCEDDGTYSVLLDLVFSDTASFPFDLWVDGVRYETYSPEDIPIVVGPFAGDGQPHTFFAHGEDQCQSAETAVQGQFCDGNCPLESVQVLDVPTCAGANGTFYHALFQLSGVNAPGDSVIVSSAITGASTLGVLDPNDGNTFDINLPNTNLGFDEVTICLFNQPDCCFSLDYDIDCPINPDCEIEGLVLEPRGCQDDGTFELFVDLEYQGPPSSIRVSIPELGWSQVYGANAFPIEIPGLIGDGQTYQVNISATDCNLELEALVEFPNCNGECTFGNVIAEPHDCENGQFMVDIEVQASNAGSLGFLTFVNGSIFGPFSYEPDFVTVGPFEGDGTTVYNILLLDFENPSCFAYLEIGPVDCSNCQIRNLSATPQPCHEDGSYDLVIDFEVDNPTDTVFTVEFGDAVVAFPLTDLPLTLAHYGLGEGGIDTLKVCIGYDNSCCERVAFEQPACLDEGCVTFEPFAGFLSPPNSGGDSWQPIGSESGVRLSYEIVDFCMCEVEVTDVAEYPFFSPGEGAILQLRQAALRAVMPSTAERVSFDYAVFNGGLQLRLPNADPILLDTLSEGIAIPLPNGNTIEMLLYPSTTPANTPMAQIILRGEIDSLQLFGYGLIDNICYERAEQEVWPGDANADNIAHHLDLLSLGLAYGSSGPARASLSSDWTELSAQNWGQAFADGTDYKHADCNGDGVIDLEDRAVILQNYGQTNGTPDPWPNLPGTDFDPPVYVPFPGTLPDNFNFQVPIIVGESDNALQDVYGIAFTVRFDPEVIDPASIAVVYPTSWFGEPGVNTLTLHQVHEDGRIEMSITRIDLNNVSGHGQVAYIIGIIDDIAGIIKESEVEIDAVICMDVNENWIPLQGRSTTFELQPDKDELPADEAKGLFTVHPNPASEWVTVSSRHNFAPDRLRLLNMSGQEIQVPTEAQRVSLAGLPSGVYLLQITTGKTSVYRRVVKH